MIPFFIPLLERFLVADYLQLWFFPLIALAFIATVPRIIRAIIER